MIFPKVEQSIEKIDAKKEISFEKEDSEGIKQRLQVQLLHVKTQPLHVGTRPF